MSVTSTTNSAETSPSNPIQNLTDIVKVGTQSAGTGTMDMLGAESVSTISTVVETGDFSSIKSSNSISLTPETTGDSVTSSQSLRTEGITATIQKNKTTNIFSASSAPEVGSSLYSSITASSTETTLSLSNSTKWTNYFLVAINETVNDTSDPVTSTITVQNSVAESVTASSQLMEIGGGITTNHGTETGNTLITPAVTGVNSASNSSYSTIAEAVIVSTTFEIPNSLITSLNTISISPVPSTSRSFLTGINVTPRAFFGTTKLRIISSTTSALASQAAPFLATVQSSTSSGNTANVVSPDTSTSLSMPSSTTLESALAITSQIESPSISLVSTSLKMDLPTSDEIVSPTIESTLIVSQHLNSLSTSWVNSFDGSSPEITSPTAVPMLLAAEAIVPVTTVFTPSQVYVAGTGPLSTTPRAGEPCLCANNGSSFDLIYGVQSSGVDCICPQQNENLAGKLLDHREFHRVLLSNFAYRLIRLGLPMASTTPTAD